MTPTADPWSATLAAALLGAERAPLAGADEPLALPVGMDPGAALLARVGVWGTHHLAGRGLAADALSAFPAFEPAEPSAPACPPAAATRLATLLTAGAAATAHVHEWCAIAAARGVRAPPELLALLDLRRGGAAGAIDPVAGAELDWLARVCAGGSGDVGEAASGGADPGTEASSGQALGDPAAADDRADGDPAARLGAFAALRRRDPDAARTALAQGFRAEKADRRAELVAVLESGLGPEDEPFLEACLDDRAMGVRAAALRLLPSLPGSRLAGRMAGRARAALRITGTPRLLGGTRHDLAVALPEEAPDLARDGIEPTPHGRRQGGPRAELLAGILSAAPLRAYAEHPPRLWVDLALRSDWAEPILAGLTAALWRARDPAWTAALTEGLGAACSGRVSGVKATDALRETRARAVAVLPPAAWEAAVAAALRGGPVEGALDLLAYGPQRFSAEFTGLALDWLARAVRLPATREALRRGDAVPRLGHRAEPGPEAEAAAARVVAALPEDADPYDRRRITDLADTIGLRAAMRREFEPT